MTIGYDKPLYVLPFDHRATFSKNMFGWQGSLSPEQTAEIAAVKRDIREDEDAPFFQEEWARLQQIEFEAALRKR